MREMEGFVCEGMSLNHSYVDDSQDDVTTDARSPQGNNIKAMAFKFVRSISDSMRGSSDQQPRSATMPAVPASIPHRRRSSVQQLLPGSNLTDDNQSTRGRRRRSLLLSSAADVDTESFVAQDLNSIRGISPVPLHSRLLWRGGESPLQAGVPDCGGRGAESEHGGTRASRGAPAGHLIDAHDSAGVREGLEGVGKNGCDDQECVVHVDAVSSTNTAGLWASQQGLGAAGHGRGGSSGAQGSNLKISHASELSPRSENREEMC